ncbi:MAG TPA: hypothetical protein VGD50_06530, partial [Candidatus Baltobacteraceae bacterium]
MHRLIRTALFAAAVLSLTVAVDGCGSRSVAVPDTTNASVADSARSQASLVNAGSATRAAYAYYPMPGYNVTSIIQASDGHTWFGSDGIPGGYIGRIAGTAAPTLFAIPNATANGVQQAVYPTVLTESAQTSGPLFFAWDSVVASTELGIGTVDLSNPSAMKLSAAGSAGDPLFSPTFAYPIIGLLATQHGSQLWSEAEATPTNGVMPQAEIWSLAYPFTSPATYATRAVPGIGLNVILGRDGNVWSPDSTHSALLRVGSAVTEFP